jgi:hypothetical protein
MSNSIVGKSISYALEDAVKRQEEINNALAKSNQEDETINLVQREPVTDSVQESVLIEPEIVILVS